MRDTIVLRGGERKNKSLNEIQFECIIVLGFFNKPIQTLHSIWNSLASYGQSLFSRIPRVSHLSIGKNIQKISKHYNAKVGLHLKPARKMIEL